MQVESTLAQIIARVPEWANAQSIQTSFLAGGLSNLNFRVDVDGQSFVVRVCGQGLELLGVNRQHEYECNVIAAEMGVAPDVIHFFPDLGTLITRFVDGRKLLSEQIGTRENIQRVVNSVRRLHQSARPFPSAWSPFRTIEEYRRTAERLGCPMPDDIDELFGWAAQIERAMYRSAPPSIVPCHNDLLNENFLDDGTIRIIDYEYAAMGDPFFDLANFSSHHRFNDEQDQWLIESYFGADRRDVASQRLYHERFARLQRMKLISDLREAMWGVVQIKVASVAFNYQAYANEWFGRFRAKRELADSRWLIANGDTK